MGSNPVAPTRASKAAREMPSDRAALSALRASLGIGAMGLDMLFGFFFALFPVLGYQMLRHVRLQRMDDGLEQVVLQPLLDR